MTRGRYRLYFRAGVALVAAGVLAALLFPDGFLAAHSRSRASSPTSTPTCRPARPCRSHRSDRHEPSSQERPRLRSAQRHREPRRDLLSRAEPHAPRRLSPEGALGRLGRARLARVAAAGRAPLHARADDLLQLRVGVRAARVRRQADARGPQVRGQPRAPGLARAQLRQGPGDAQPGPGSRPHPPSAEARGPPRREPLGARLLGRGAHDIAGRIRKAIVEGRRNEVMYHVGRPGEDGYTERVLAAWGVDGHNSHTNICSSSGARGLPVLDGLRPAEPRPRERRASSC